MYKAFFWLMIFSLMLGLPSCAQTQSISSAQAEVITGAEQTYEYFPLLRGKSVGVFANPTSVIKNTHLVDSLLHAGITVTTIFGPEHGFRGKADAGEHIENGVDSKTGVKVISLYGDHKKPIAKDLEDLDILVFDIQDVGVRFYTFISSLQYFIEAALENKKPLIILDRPNPNGFYVDGPVLDKSFSSFVGMQPIPVVHGMTIGEYALMICGEGWLTPGNDYADPKRLLAIISCLRYDHKTKYVLPVNPSPNLKQMQSIYLYPSTCFFEGTVLSEGRGTETPFQVFGHPTLPKKLFSFTPKPNEGAKSSKCYNQLCYGWNLSGATDEVLKLVDNKLQIKYLLRAYEMFPGKDSFFLKNNFFNKLAGNDKLMSQIKSGLSENEIRKSWVTNLEKFKAIRKKYLLYKDFE